MCIHVRTKQNKKKPAIIHAVKSPQPFPLFFFPAPLIANVSLAGLEEQRMAGGWLDRDWVVFEINKKKKQTNK